MTILTADADAASIMTTTIGVMGFLTNRTHRAIPIPRTQCCAAEALVVRLSASTHIHPIPPPPPTHPRTHPPAHTPHGRLICRPPSADDVAMYSKPARAAQEESSEPTRLRCTSSCDGAVIEDIDGRCALLDLVACAENMGDTGDLCAAPQVQEQDGSGCCFPSPDEIPADDLAEMQAVQDACANVFTPCFGENVTPMNLETCGFATPPCVSAVELCTAVEANGQGIVDPTACSAAGYCEVMDMMLFGQKVGEVCGPSQDNVAGRAVFSCSMDIMMEMRESRMDATLVEMMDGFARSCPQDVMAACDETCRSAIMGMIMADLPEDDDRAMADYVASMPESAVAI
eukprot:COSAG02_NODE_7881_length_2805_cov_1.717664_1_plen_343_part_10